MKKTAFFAAFNLLVAVAASGAPAKGGALPVAEGYPAWTGITPKNYITGRVLMSDAELRQRITVVIEFDASKTLEQVDLVGDLAALNNYATTIGHGSENWETVQLPREVMVIFVAHNAKDHELVKNALKIKDADEAKKHPNITQVMTSQAPFYENVTFEGAPDNGGKFPFVYVMGYEGKEPVVKCEWDAKKTRAAVRKAVSEQRNKISSDGLTWRPFYGYVAEPKHFKDIEKALAKGKPLEPVEAKLQKSVTAKDPEVAKEAQMLYDGLAQTKSELAQLVKCSYVACPHVAAYNLGMLLKYWPKTKKQMSVVQDKLKANDAAQPLVKMYPKIAQWADPNFTCKNAGEAKKIVGELTKMKAALQPLKDDKNVTVQNGALIVDGIVDELIVAIPSRVASK